MWNAPSVNTSRKSEMVIFLKACSSQGRRCIGEIAKIKICSFWRPWSELAISTPFTYEVVDASSNVKTCSWKWNIEKYISPVAQLFSFLKVAFTWVVLWHLQTGVHVQFGKNLPIFDVEICHHGGLHKFSKDICILHAHWLKFWESPL